MKITDPRARVARGVAAAKKSVRPIILGALVCMTLGVAPASSAQTCDPMYSGPDPILNVPIRITLPQTIAAAEPARTLNCMKLDATEIDPASLDCIDLRNKVVTPIEYEKECGLVTVLYGGKRWYASDSIFIAQPTITSGKR